MMRDAAGPWSSLPSGKVLPLMTLSLPRSTGITSGYPYFLQEWGYQLWMTAERSPITLTDFAAAQKIVVGASRSEFLLLTPRAADGAGKEVPAGHGQPWPRPFLSVGRCCGGNGQENPATGPGP